MSTLHKTTLLISIIFVFISCSEYELGDKQVIIPEYTFTTPLLTINPAFNAFSPGKHLTDSAFVNIEGADQELTGIIRIDGICYRFLGNSILALNVAQEKDRKIGPTQSWFSFEAGGIKLELTFSSPTLLIDPYLSSRPAAYIEYNISSLDETEHEVQLYIEASSKWLSGTKTDSVVWENYPFGGIQLLKMEIPGKQQLYLSPDPTLQTNTTIAAKKIMQTSFVSSGKLQLQDNFDFPQALDSLQVSLACSYNFSKVNESPKNSFTVITQNSNFGILQQNGTMKTAWETKHNSDESMLSDASKSFSQISSACKAFDAAFFEEVTKSISSDIVPIATHFYRNFFLSNWILSNNIRKSFSYNPKKQTSLRFSSFLLLFNKDLYHNLLNQHLNTLDFNNSKALANASIGLNMLNEFSTIDKSRKYWTKFKQSADLICNLYRQNSTLITSQKTKVNFDYLDALTLSAISNIANKLSLDSIENRYQLYSDSILTTWENAQNNSIFPITVDTAQLLYYAKYDHFLDLNVIEKTRFNFNTDTIQINPQTDGYEHIFLLLLKERLTNQNHK